MKITMVGTGYVGLVTGACFAEVGIDVTCVDIDQKKIENLNNGMIPIYEPGLEELVKRNVEKGRLHFSTKLSECLEGVNVIFGAVGTPPDEDGSADLKYVLQVAREVGQHMQDYLLMVTKSTVPVGTAEKVRNAIQEELDKRGVKIPFDVASNPEFLKEGSAVEDFAHPDRIVVARNGSPLILGVGDREMFIASDLSALVRHTTSVVHLDDGELATVLATGFRTFSREEENTAKKPVSIDIEAGDVDLAGYRHFMRKEILEQPASAERMLRGRIDEPIVTEAAMKSGSEQVTLPHDVPVVAAATSADAGGGSERTVGYLGAAFD